MFYLLCVFLFSAAAAQDSCTACTQSFRTWCSNEFGGGFCTTSSPGSGVCGANRPVTSSGSCPPPPPLPPEITVATLTGATGQTVALAPTLGGVAGVILCLLTLTNVEGLSGKPPTSSPVSTRTLLSILAAATLLWFATGFLLAAPTVPWVWLRLSPFTTYSGSMLSFSICQAPPPGSGPSSLLCQSLPLGTAIQVFAAGIGSIPLPSGGTTTLPAIAADAQNVAVCCYVFGVLILLPAAALASASAYRLKQYLAHGTPTPIEGCAFMAFPAATFLSLLGLLCTIGTMGAAIHIAAPTISGSVVPALIPNLQSAVQVANLPGPVYGALAITCCFLAFALLLVPALCNPDMKTLSGYGLWCGCRISCNSGAPPPLPAQLQGAAPIISNPTQIAPAPPAA